MIEPLALLPILAPAASAILVLLVAMIRPGSPTTLAVALIGLALGLVAIPFTAQATGALLTVDGSALLFSGFVILGALAVLPLAWTWLEGEDADGMLVLVCLTALAGCLLAAAAHLATVLLGIELLSVALYGAIGFARERRPALQAAVRYLILAAGSSAAMIYGLALIYADLGALTLDALGGGGALERVGLGLVLLGIAFKLGLAPVHSWVPDVYQGAPAPITTLLATVSKVAVLALLVRLARPLTDELWWVVALALLAGASMVVGNLLALRENSMQRLLGGSSIAHMGYALVPLVAGDEQAVAIYVGSYLPSALTAFGVVSLLSRRHKDTDVLDRYQGLLWRQPVAGGLLAFGLLSLAGIPLTAGFVGKLYALLAALDGGLGALVLLLVVGSALGLFYYLRVLAVLFRADVGHRTPGRALSWAPVLVAAALTLLVGVFPPAMLALMPSPPTSPTASAR